MSENDSTGEGNAGTPGAENAPMVARLCYVDDSRTSAYVVRRLLQPLGYQVDHFSSAEPAFVALVQEDYDLLLTDLKVSPTGMDGDDLIRTLRQSGHPKISTMPIIVITGASDAEVLVGVYDAGANQVMKKPVDGDELDGHIRRLLFDSRRGDSTPGNLPPTKTPSRKSNSRVRDATVVTLHTAHRPPGKTQTPDISPLKTQSSTDVTEVPVLTAVEPSAPVPTESPARVDAAKPTSPSSNEQPEVSTPPEAEMLRDSSIVRQMEGLSTSEAPGETKTTKTEDVDKVRIIEPGELELRVEMSVEEEVVIIEPDMSPARQGYGAARQATDHDLLRELDQYPLVITQRKSLFAGSSVVNMLHSLVGRVGLRRLLVRAVGLIIALFALLVGANAYFNQGQPVDTVFVASGEIFQSISVPGRVVSKQRVNISSARTGRLVEILVKEGDKVQLGQVLAKVDDRELLGRLKRAQVSMSAAREDISQAQRTLDRLRKAHSKGAVARRFVEDAEVDLRAARNRAGVVVEEVRSVSSDINQQKIVAVFAGMITTRYAEIGQWVGPSETLFTLVDESQREIEVRVNAADSMAIAVGQVVTVSSDAFPGQKWQESVVRLGAEAGSGGNANSVKAYVSLGEDAPTLRYGQQVNTDIRTAWNPNTLKIPFEALIHRDGQTMVAVLEDGRVHMKMVEAGLRDFAMTEIKQGLSEGERVILSKGQLLQNGDRVQARREND